jgi:hypothetical protein
VVRLLRSWVVAGSPEGPAEPTRKQNNMEYGIGGILILILVILAIVYFAKRV